MKSIKIQTLNPLSKKLSSKPIIACWGFFDGVHQGHQALFKKVVEIGKKNNYKTCVISFDIKPQTIISNSTNQILLNNEDKIKNIARFDFAYYLEIEFTKHLATVSPAQFIAWLIAINVKAVVVSPNIRFGYKNQGNLQTLQASALQIYLCDDVFTVNSHKISSTYIKQLLQNKDILNANLCLQPNLYTICGKVVHGIKEGRTIGFPTANLALVANYALPGLATYITLTAIDNKWYKSMTVIMMRDNMPLVETYLLNFNQDLYDKVIKVKFLSYLRDNLDFSNLEALKMQLYNDLANTIQYFADNN